MTTVSLHRLDAKTRLATHVLKTLLHQHSMHLVLSHCCTADMRFASSSRMRPRWLVLTMVLPNEDVLFVHYKVPTIIMSRTCDQNEKVCFLAPCLDPSIYFVRQLTTLDSELGCSLG